jgi:hypothetical protein
VPAEGPPAGRPDLELPDLELPDPPDALAGHGHRLA